MFILCHCILEVHNFIFIIILVVLGFELGLMVASQALYHLKQEPALFCFNYFSERVPCFLFKLALDHASQAPATKDQKYHVLLAH
jgi:hypothetical protein